MTGATPWAGHGYPGARSRAHGAHRCDVAIIGGGLTGLSTALELTGLDPGLRVVVIEADQVGSGASGRGTGLLGPRLGPGLGALVRRHGEGVARAAYHWSVAAVRHVLELVEREQLSCGLTPGSQLVVASDPAIASAQQREADAARRLGLPISLVTGEALPALGGGYLSGLRYAPAATLDPVALTTQLARRCEQRGVLIFERSAARSVRRGLLTTVHTDDAEIVAGHVVVAVNAFAAELPGPAGVVGVRVQAGVTEKLSAPALDALAGLHTEPVIGAGELRPYFRLTSDGRLVVGGGAVARGPHGSLAPVPGRLRAAVRSLSPLLSAVDVESTWAGPIGVTRDGLPIVGQRPDDPGLFHAGGCNGHGLAVAVYHGAVVARWIAHGGPDPLAFALPWVRWRAPWMPRGRLVDRVLDRYLAHRTVAADQPTPGRPAARPRMIGD